MPGEKINVYVGSLPGGMSRFELDRGATVKDALGKAGIGADGKRVTVNNAQADLNARLDNDATVSVTGKISGNLIF